MPKARLFVLILIAGFVLAGVTLAWAGANTDDGLLWVLPDITDLKALKAEDAPQQAKSEGLYDLINGGASLYLSNGFKQVLVQDYRAPEGTLFNLEIFELDTPDNAKKVFALKGGDPAKPCAIAQACSLEEYYGLFLQGTYYITVTASESTKQAQELIKQVAQAVVKKIQDKEKKAPPSSSVNQKP